MNKLFKSTEEVVSMFLGLVIVLVIVGIIFNFFQRRRGNITLPGVTNEDKQALLPTESPLDKNVYVVKKGDNLWKIAKYKTGNGDNWVKIAKDNNLKNPRVLVEGQKIIIAELEIKPPENNDNYVIQRGDNLWKIAVSNFGDGYKWVDIWNLNRTNIRDPNRLEIGMVLKLK